jgi:hypothetical protein
LNGARARNPGIANRPSADGGSGESYSDVILRLAAGRNDSLTGPDGQARPIRYFSLGDRVMFQTAWIDRPVDTQGLHSLLPRPPQCSMVVQPCLSHSRMVILRLRR